jgi:hypothetical protein
MKSNMLSAEAATVIDCSNSVALTLLSLAAIACSRSPVTAIAYSSSLITDKQL